MANITMKAKDAIKSLDEVKNTLASLKEANSNLNASWTETAGNAFCERLSDHATGMEASIEDEIAVAQAAEKAAQVYQAFQKNAITKLQSVFN